MQQAGRMSRAAVAALAVGALAHADLLPGFELADTPDIASFFIEVAYDADTDTLTADGYSFALDIDGSAPTDDIEDGSFAIEATIDDAGMVWSGGLLIEGSVPSLSVPGPTLLTGDLVGFGWGTTAPTWGPFQFVFEVTGGGLATLYGGVGAQVGVNLTQDVGYGGDWGASFHGGGIAVADTATLAEPVDISNTPLCDCNGDTNCDGEVNVTDLILVILSWGDCPVNCLADFNGDHSVDVADLLQLTLNWGLCDSA